MFNIERLEVWQKAVDFAAAIYRATRSFPTDEHFGLTNQMRAAAVSVGSNLPEGSARSDADFARFIRIASDSPYEVVTQVAIARRRRQLDDEYFAKIYRDAEEISRMLSGLRGSLRPHSD